MAFPKSAPPSWSSRPCCSGPTAAGTWPSSLEVHYLSNPDAHFRYALLTDFADASAEIHPEEEDWLTAAVREIRALNRQYAADGPDIFYLLHRKRCWNPSMKRWMGVERKRGKLSEFNRLLRRRPDTTFTTITGNLDQMPTIRYVLTLDTDTRLPREAARRLVATIHHPLNRPHFDPAVGRVVEGFGILQPRVSLPLSAWKRSWFAQDFFGFGGSRSLYHRRFRRLPGLVRPRVVHGQGNLRCGCVRGGGRRYLPGQPHPEPRPDRGQLRALRIGHRCRISRRISDQLCRLFARAGGRARGDWQILPWLLRGAWPEGTKRHNPLPLLERWKIFDNLRRTLVPPTLVAMLILGSTILPGSAWTWIGAVLVATFMPTVLFLVGDLGTVIEVPFKLVRRDFRRRLAATAGQCFLTVVFLAEQSFAMLDAALRTLWRLFITRRNLLEWESAAAADRRLGTHFKDFLASEWPASAFAAAVACLLAVLEPGALASVGPFLLLWFLSPWVAYLISRLPTVKPSPLMPGDRLALRRLARRTWGFFETFVTKQENWLPPDNYQEDPKGEIAHRTSPTNKGLYLLSVIAAHDLGYLTIPNVLERLENTFDTLEKLERRHGHFCNWYDTLTLQPLPPLYLSTVDSGNLLACLLVLRQALQEKKQAPFACAGVQEGLEDALGLLADALGAVEPRKAHTWVAVVKSLESTLYLLTSHLRPPGWFGGDARLAEEN